MTIYSNWNNARSTTVKHNKLQIISVIFVVTDQIESHFYQKYDKVRFDRNIHRICILILKLQSVQFYVKRNAVQNYLYFFMS